MATFTFDCESYFKLQLNVHRLWWKRWYDTFREQAGDYQNMSFAQSAVLLRLFQSFYVPDKFLALSEVNLVSAPADTIKVEFYIAVHNEFLSICSSTAYKPMTVFIGDPLLRLTYKFFRKYFRARGAGLYKQHELAKEKTSEYADNANAIMHIIDWLAFCFAREPFIETSRNSPAVQADSVKLVEDVREDLIVLKKSTTESKRIPEIPKKEETFRDWMQYAKKVESIFKNDPNRTFTSIYLEIATEFKTNSKKVKSADYLKRFIDKEKPNAERENYTQTFAWLKTLKNNSL